jgi:AraC family transcriptional activator of mtrCDE
MYMTEEEHGAGADTNFRAVRSPDFRVIGEQHERPLPTFVYIVKDNKVARETLGGLAPSSMSSCHCDDTMTTSPRTALVDENVHRKPLARISPSDLDNLITTLEVDLVKLSECVVSAGSRLTLAATDAPDIYYSPIGMGRMNAGDHAPIGLHPHTFVIIPAGRSFCIEAAVDRRHSATLVVAEGSGRTYAPGVLRRVTAGSGEPELILIWGRFRATYGASIDVFKTLLSPIVEQFSAADRLEHRLSSAMRELVAEEVGTGAMAAALMKQVLITLLRRSLTTNNLWAERFSMLGDPQVARAFAEMVTNPELPNSVESLAQTAGLSRSVFMARFTRLFGKPPKATLRDLRMRRAAVLLTTSCLSVDQIAHRVGYTSRSSFSRMFRNIHGCDPSEYRDMRKAVNPLYSSALVDRAGRRGSLT